MAVAGSVTPARRTHEERHVVLHAVVRLQVRRVDAARQIVGHRELEVRLPARIVEVVVVEEDGAVLLRYAAMIHLASRPVPARHRASGGVHQARVEPVPRAVTHPCVADVETEIPACDQR
jgi:hypothetical protein